jgi:phosphotransferase system HPr (HPr) family protein
MNMMTTHRKPPHDEASGTITIRNQLGLHARPAAEFVRQANVFRSEIWLVTEAGRFSALSLLEVMRANLDCGKVATIEARGPDAKAAIARLVKVVHEMKDYED